MKALFLQILTLTFLFGCSTNERQNTATNLETRSPIDTLYKLLDLAIALDTLEFNAPPTLYIKTGHLLAEKNKSAVLIYSKDTSEFYSIELYSLDQGKWEKKDQIDSLEIYPVQFYVEYCDYNFDYCKDILFQKSTSNGISLSYKYLLTVDPLTNKIKEHPEFLKLSNTAVDNKNKKINSMELQPCPYVDVSVICNVTSMWDNDTIKTMKKDCPCKPLK